MVAPQPRTSDHADLGLTRSRGAERSWNVAEEEVVESVASPGPFFYKSAAAGFAAGRSKKEGSVTVIDGGC